jgi:hypothetical protein
LGEGKDVVEVTREQLYERVWAEPAVKLAKELGVSGPGLAKACRTHGIPVPERGYWARLAGGKRVSKRPLPPRGLGMPSVVAFSRGRYGYREPESELNPDLPPPPAPEFPESMDKVRARVAKLVGRVRPVASLEDAVPAVRQYLEADEERRRKIAASKYVWDTPKFESPTEQRRLRILNSLALQALQLGCPVLVRGTEAHNLSIRVGEQHVGFKLEPAPGAARVSGRGRPLKDPVRLRFEISRRYHPGGALQEWADAKGDPIERHLSEILAELLVTGEQFHRDHAEYRYRWILERRQRVLDDRRRKEEEAERQRIERIEAAKRARRERLAKDAADWRTACDLRAYVAAVEAVYSEQAPNRDQGLLAEWAAWARSEAMRVDPIAGRGAVFDPYVENDGNASNVVGRQR